MTNLNEAVKIIKEFEGLRLKPYVCPAERTKTVLAVTTTAEAAT